MSNNEYMINADKYAMSIMHFIEQRILYYKNLIEFKNVDDFDSQTSMKAFANSYAITNNAKNRIIDSFYDKINDRKSLNKVYYEKDDEKVIKFIKKVDYEYQLNNDFYNNCYDFIDHEISKKFETKNENFDMLKK